jgi:hypothetical protein
VSLDDAIRRVVRDELAALGVGGHVESYDRDHLPPGFVSREAFASECRRLGLDRVAYRPGRGWRIPSDVWRAARREARERRRVRPVADDDAADQMLSRAGLRLIHPTQRKKAIL